MKTINTYIFEGIDEIESSQINLSSFHPKARLNPKFWVNNHINSRVRLKLLDIADDFFEFCNVDWVKPVDIVLTGSIANYNWSKYSDVDVHILVDYKEVWEKTDFVEEYFNAKKALWGEEHDSLKIYGFPVELYIEDANAENNNTGIYSLNKNEWIVEPGNFQDATLNSTYIKEQSAKIMTFIDDIEKQIKKNDDIVQLRQKTAKIKEMFDLLHKKRKESINSNGEMGTYNIIWKVLRRSGYLDKMWEMINDVYDKANSLV